MGKHHNHCQPQPQGQKCPHCPAIRAPPCLPGHIQRHHQAQVNAENAAERARIAAEQARAAERARIEAEQARAAERARIEAEKARAAERARIEAEKNMTVCEVHNWKGNGNCPECEFDKQFVNCTSHQWRGLGACPECIRDGLKKNCTIHGWVGLGECAACIRESMKTRCASHNWLGLGECPQCIVGRVPPMMMCRRHAWSGPEDCGQCSNERIELQITVKNSQETIRILQDLVRQIQTKENNKQKATADKFKDLMEQRDSKPQNSTVPTSEIGTAGLALNVNVKSSVPIRPKEAETPANAPRESTALRGQTGFQQQNGASTREPNDKPVAINNPVTAVSPNSPKPVLPTSQPSTSRGRNSNNGPAAAWTSGQPNQTALLEEIRDARGRPSLRALPINRESISSKSPDGRGGPSRTPADLHS